MSENRHPATVKFRKNTMAAFPARRNPAKDFIFGTPADSLQALYHNQSPTGKFLSATAFVLMSAHVCFLLLRLALLSAGRRVPWLFQCYQTTQTLTVVELDCFDPASCGRIGSAFDLYLPWEFGLVLQVMAFVLPLILMGAFVMTSLCPAAYALVTARSRPDRWMSTFDLIRADMAGRHSTHRAFTGIRRASAVLCASAAACLLAYFSDVAFAMPPVVVDSPTAWCTRLHNLVFFQAMVWFAACAHALSAVVHWRDADWYARCRRVQSILSSDGVQQLLSSWSVERDSTILHASPRDDPAKLCAFPRDDLAFLLSVLSHVNPSVWVPDVFVTKLV
eukprot:TRINITY_DN9013_c0_g2_i2.p1 TRINITY_DN9013_c0_g2~~TRINITY_DN9013_c0_g2_i2.p1  ORF type:complete len:335 (+),score=46.43 TRINITY_DN9013_c0_g2_i2:229-1233(+)